MNNQKISKIRIAVEPLKKDAIEKAETWAKNQVDEMWNELLENDLEIKKTAPYPRDPYDYDYQKKANRHDRFCFCFGSGRKEAAKNEFMINRFIQEAMDNAAFQYDKFIFKLEQKCGNVESAKLEGNHVWDYSFLTVKKDGETQVWKTTMITNYSKHGKAFCQFPTRKVKNRKLPNDTLVLPALPANEL
jgi:hypothetical protein